MARIQDNLPQALKAIDKLLAGEVPSFGPMEDLRIVEEFLGLKRPLASYAPRTRRRYIAAVRAGDRGAKQTKAKERATRSGSTKARYGLTPAQLTKLNKVRNPIIQSGVDINGYLEPKVIKDIVTMYGFDYMMKVLTQQEESIRAWTKGSREPGRTRWLNRGELEDQAKHNLGSKFGAAVMYVNGTDPYYYYHGRLV